MGSQSPSTASDASFWAKTLSTPWMAFSNLRVFLASFVWSFTSGAKRASTPGRVGKKKGAFSGTFGGSFGLFLCWRLAISHAVSKWVKSHACITSRLRRVCHRERGRRVRVINSPSNWGGVEKTSIGASDAVNAESASKSEKTRWRNENTLEEGWPSSSASPCIEGRETSKTSLSLTLWKDTSANWARLALY